MSGERRPYRGLTPATHRFRTDVDGDLQQRNDAGRPPRVASRRRVSRSLGSVAFCQELRAGLPGLISLPPFPSHIFRILR